MSINLQYLQTNKHNNIFVETGSHYGDGIQLALEAGFEKIISIECNEQYYLRCVDRFCGNEKVQLYYGDSSVDLSKMISDINESVTFWLDAHYMWNDPNQDIEEHPGRGKIPLIDELTQIKNHHIKDHVIIIDDLNPLSCLSPIGDKPPTGSIETKAENLITFVSTINERYTFTVQDIDNQDVFLVCKVL
jgi:hypothetical protein